MPLTVHQMTFSARLNPGRLAELNILIIDAQNRIADAEARASAFNRQLANLDGQRKALLAELGLLIDARKRLNEEKYDA